MKMDIKVRVADRGDLSFLMDSQNKMALETEDFILDRAKLEQGVLKFLDSKIAGKYFIASHKGKKAGCMLIQYEWSDWRNAWVLWIHSVFVLPEFRKKGVFKTLFEHAKSHRPDESDVCGLRLFVDKRNKNACNVYEKLGMDQEHYALYELMF